MSSIEIKLNKLQEKLEGGREDHLAEIESMRKTVKMAMLKKSLQEHPALKKLLAMLKKREEGYTLLLANKPLEPIEKRAFWDACRTEDRFLLSFFGSADIAIEGVEKRLDYQLSADIEETVDN